LSLSAPANLIINRGLATVGLTSSAGSTVYGQSVTFVAMVKVAGTPSGTVTFFNGVTPLATVAVDGSGKAMLATAALPAGSQGITASYSGNADFLGARSAATLETVTPDAAQIISVAHKILKKKRLQAVSLTAEIEPLAPGGGLPTGSVTFELLTKQRKKIKVTKLGTAAVVGGQATLTFKPQKVLNKVLTIVYSGDSNFQTATITLPKLTQKSLH
jgi:Bacterial Ig-like domain (group 3)